MAYEYQTGQNSYSLVSADINGDAITDIVTPNINAQTVSVAYGDGAGGFAPPRFFASGEFTIRILAVGDLNNDGKPDLVAPHESQSKFVVMLNNGQGGFSAPAVLTFPNTVTEFYDLKIGDFNGDGKADVAGMSRLNLYIFFGNGQGGLTLNATLPWDGNNTRIAVGNFNNDNLTDLAIFSGTNNYPYELVIILGNAGGSFTYNNRYPLTNRPNDIALGDFNGDSLTDIAISANYPFQNSTPPTYHLQPWFGNGGGSFTEGAKVFFPYAVDGVAAGDFNGDGKLDLATSMTEQLTATVYGIGDGTFQNLTYWTTPVGGRLSAIDVNRDGKKDLISLRGGSPNSFISVVLSAGNNGFFVPKPALYGGTHIAAGDFNGDNLLDLLTGYYTSFASPSQITVALNNGSGGWQADRDYDTALAFDALAIGDFNGDGKKDALTGHDYNGKLYSAYLGDGSGNLAAPISQAWTRGIRDLVAGDFNNDGKDDFMFLDEQRGYSRLSNGDGTFSAVPNFAFEPTNVSITPRKGDFNRDGKLDFIISDGATAYIWLGAGNGTFAVSDSEPFNAARIAVGDVNGDGNLDLLGFTSAGGSETTLRGILGNADGTFGAAFSKTIPGAASAIISADFNGDGLADAALAPASVSFNGGITLFIIPSTGQTPFWGTPVVYSVADLAGPAGSQDRIVAADFNADGKIDIGYAGFRSRGVIYNTSNQNPCVSINDVTVTEGDSGSSNAAFTVSLSAASSQTVRVNHTLAAQTAAIGEDLQNVSGRLEIPAGQTTATINVPINGDLVDEFDETFTVNLTSPTNAALGKSAGTGTILDNDAEPSMTITDVSQVEPTFSQGTIFRVSLSAPSAKPISFRCSTADGTATAGKDYLAGNLTVNFQTGATSADCYVNLLSDNIYELDETFFVNISEVTNANLTDAQGIGKILNDDPIPSLNIFSNNLTEGDYGTTNGTVNVQLSNPSYLPISFNVLTSAGTATADSDYIASDTVVTVPAEQQTVTASVQIIGDAVNEPNETFFVNLYNVSNATLGTTQAQYLIIDDENITNDFDRDGKTDFAVFRPSEGTWYTLFSSNGSFSGTRYGLGSDIPVSGDYNGDGRSDIAVWRASNGTWYTPIANRTQPWGTDGDIPVQGDYDNDGRIDLAVFRPSTGYWYIRLTSNNTLRYVPFGAADDIPVPADYDGDGKTDIAVFRPSNGIWYITRSSDNNYSAATFGQLGDKLVPADYDGDGKADIAVFRNGFWYYLKSSAGNAFASFQWGQAGDKPVPGNYDGDGKTDFAVYRNGAWYVYQSSDGTVLFKQFGASDDTPIPFVSNN